MPLAIELAVTAWRFSAQSLAQELADQGELAEQLGFDSFWLPESHFTAAAAIPSPLMLLACVAARTTKLRLGSTSYLLPIRNPILAAEEVAVLDRLSNGRVILGMGRGYQDAMFKPFNIPINEKRTRFKENLAKMISAWQGEPIDQHDGQDILLSPLPVQKPYPPLWVAAFGPLAIKQAGSLGLPYIASPIEGLTSLKENYDQHRRHVADAGHEPVPLVPVMRTIFVTDKPAMQQRVRASLEEEATARLRRTVAEVEDWALVGDKSYVRDRLAEYAEAIGLNYLIARGRIQGVASGDQVASHEALLDLVNA